MRLRTSNCSLLLIYLSRRDERLSRPGWLTYSGRFTHISGHPSAAGRAQDGKSSLVKDQCSLLLYFVLYFNATNELDERQNSSQSYVEVRVTTQRIVKRCWVCWLDELTRFETRLTAEDAVVRVRAESRLDQQLAVGQPRTVRTVDRQLLSLQLCTRYTLHNYTVKYTQRNKILSITLFRTDELLYKF